MKKLNQQSHLFLICKIKSTKSDRFCSKTVLLITLDEPERSSEKRRETFLPIMSISSFCCAVFFPSLHSIVMLAVTDGMQKQTYYILTDRN